MKTTSKFFVVANAAVVALVAKAPKAAEGQLVVSAATDLHGMSLGEMTKLYNTVTGEAKGTFKCSKAHAAEKVFAAMQTADFSALVAQDTTTKTKVERKAKVKAANTEPKERKVRDSKLQRMAAAFREQDENGAYKVWTVEQLMEKTGAEFDVVKVYLSVLKRPTDHR